MNISDFPPNILSEPPRLVQPVAKIGKARMIAWCCVLGPPALIACAVIRSFTERSMAMLPASSSYFLDLTTGICLLAWTLLFLALAAPLEMMVWRQRRMLREGSPAVATITRVRLLYQGIAEITYAFEANGRAWGGKSLYYHKTPDEAVIGQPVSVLYLPGCPQKSQPMRSIESVTLRPLPSDSN